MRGKAELRDTARIRHERWLVYLASSGRPLAVFFFAASLEVRGLDVDCLSGLDRVIATPHTTLIARIFFETKYLVRPLFRAIVSCTMICTPHMIGILDTHDANILEKRPRRRSRCIDHDTSCQMLPRCNPGEMFRRRCTEIRDIPML